MNLAKEKEETRGNKLVFFVFPLIIISLIRRRERERDERSLALKEEITLMYSFGHFLD